MITYDKRRVESEISKIYNKIDTVIKEHGEDFYAMDLRIKLMILECLNHIAGKRGWNNE